MCNTPLNVGNKNVGADALGGPYGKQGIEETGCRGRQPLQESVDGRTATCGTPIMLIIKKKQRIPGDHIAAVLEIQTVFFQHRDHIDAIAFDARMHPLGHPARLTIQVGAALTFGAGLCGENKGIHTLLPHQFRNLVGNGLVVNAGGEGFLNIRDVPHLHDGADQ